MKSLPTASDGIILRDPQNAEELATALALFDNQPNPLRTIRNRTRPARRKITPGIAMHKLPGNG